MNAGSAENKLVSRRGYIIALNKWHSRLALVASLFTVLLALFAISGGIVINVKNGEPAENLFRWFTINSNSLTAFSAGMIIPFAVEGMRKRHFSYPKWVAMLHYSGMVCTTLTMVFSVTFMSLVDPVAAFGGYNLYLHIFCPVLVLVSFFQVESGYTYTRKEAVLSTIPVFLYEAVYLVEVFVVGKENGGWEDFYHMGTYIPFWLSLIGVTSLGLGISLGIRFLNNRKVMRARQKRLANLWPKDVLPAEIRVEIFGLGRFMGKHADETYVELPLKLFRFIADNYGLKADELYAPYFRGILDSIEDKALLSGNGREKTRRRVPAQAQARKQDEDG